MANPCICNINGYPVKDTTARKKIEETNLALQQSINALLERIAVLELEVETLRAKDSLIESEIEDLKESGVGGFNVIFDDEKDNITIY